MSTMHTIENAINLHRSSPQLFHRVSNIELVEQFSNTFFHYSHRLSFQSSLAKNGIGMIIPVDGSRGYQTSRGLQISNFHNQQKLLWQKGCSCHHWTISDEQSRVEPRRGGSNIDPPQPPPSVSPPWSPALKTIKTMKTMKTLNHWKPWLPALKIG